MRTTRLTGETDEGGPMAFRVQMTLRRAGVAACALALAATAPAAAQSSRDCACGGARVPLPPTAGAAKPVPQSAPTWPVHPQTLIPARRVTASSRDGFQWDDAGIGAGAAVTIVVAGFGAAFAVRRRRATEPPLPA
jgi:hypothetical protein